MCDRITGRICAAVSPWMVAGMLAGIAAAGGEDERSARPPAMPDPSQAIRSVSLEGFVLEPDGTPAEGALVVSRAGGRAVTDASGAYRLVISVSPEQRSVPLTAVGKGGLGRLARTSVTWSGAGTRVEPLVLALGASCDPRWLPTFGAQPGTDYIVRAFAVHDDGSGPALFVAGYFDMAGPVLASQIAKWDGTSWSDVGGGFETTVHALVVYDDGDGPKLYAGGGFWTAGGVTVNKVARWDGTSWSALGVGVNGSGPVVRALAVYDDGSGAALYVAGEFTSAGGAPANRIAKWNGASWSALGAGVAGSLGTSDSVHALAVYDDGSGSALYVGGGFTRAGGVSGRSGIARWNGSAWSAVGSGMNGPVRALATFDGGGGLELHAGGSFTTAGGSAASSMARWNGTSWSSVGSGTSGAVHALCVLDHGGGPALFAGGEFATAGSVTANGIARWDGSDWSALGSGTAGGTTEYPSVLALAAYDDGSGLALFAGGYLNSAGGLATKYIARWNGASWSALGSGLSASVSALTVFDDGSGPALYAGGGFVTSAAGAARIARWDGASWSPLGSGLEPADPGEYALVRALVVHDDGSGPALYAGGVFDLASGAPASNIARWDGVSWTSLGSGVTGGAHPSFLGVFALESYDDGSGPALYAGGGFASAGGQPANRIAKWDGSAWQPLGAGMTGPVYCFTVYDDGAGPALYAGGNFNSAGGTSANKIARWDGSSWSRLGSGIGSPFGFPPDVLALQVHDDDGGGPSLFVGGTFLVAGGIEIHGIARWRAGSWSGLTLNRNVKVYCLGVFDDGSGPALHAGGTFLGLQGVGRWDGSSWTILGTPMPYSVFGHIPFALAAHDDGSGPALFAAGTSLESGDTHLSKWGYPQDLEPPELACPASLEIVDGLGGPSGESVDFVITASDCRDPAPSVVCVPPSGSFFPRGTTLVTCTATDASGNESTCQFPVIVRPKFRPR